MMEISYDNNDFGTFLILTGSWSLILFFYYVIRKEISHKNVETIEFTILTLFLAVIFYRNIETFRLFKTQCIITDVIVKKTFTHDTRQINTNFYFDKDKKLKVYNSQTGDNIFYLVSNDNVYTVCKRIVPQALAVADPGDKIRIEAWKYFNSNSPYEIFKILKKLKET